MCFVLVASALWEASCGPSPVEPEDQELIAIFHAHRQAFEKLQGMTGEDAQRGWYLGASDFSKLALERQQGYQRLISEIRPGLEVAINGQDDVVRFIFALEGTAIGPGWVKGIEYVPGDYSREGVLSADLDGARKLPANVYLRQIEPKWFVFYQRDE